MLLYFPPRGQPYEEDDSLERADFASFADEEIKDLRQKYKKWEKPIFALSWTEPSVKRYENTCIYMSEAFDRARKDHDEKVVFCPWIFEGLHTLMADLVKPLGNVRSDKEYAIWKKDTEETIEHLCVAFGFLMKSVTGYVDEVFPVDEPAQCKWIDEVRQRLKAFFDITNRDDATAFVGVAADILFDLKHKPFPMMNSDVLGALAEACPTRGWPKVSRIAEDEPRIVYNLTNEEILELMGQKPLSPEERESIDRECKDEMIREKLDGAEAAAEKLFRDGKWYMKSNVEIAMWRLARAACTIARKAQRDHDYYFYSSSKMPSVLLSEMLRSSRSDAFAPLFTSCSSQVCEDLPRMLLSGFKQEQLKSASLVTCSGMKAMMHFLEMLPHDGHLNAAARAAEKWTTRLGDIVNGTRRIEKSCLDFITAAKQFGEELQLASDALNESESKVRDRQEREAHGDDPLVERFMQRLKSDPIPATVDGFSKIGRQEALAIVRSKGKIKGLFTQPNLSKLFGTHINTIANWMGGKTAIPDGFAEALEQKDYDGMIVCAERYRAERGKVDVMEAKHLVRNASDELLMKLGANMPDGRCENPQ